MKNTPVNLSAAAIDGSAVIVGVYRSGEMTSSARQIDSATSGAIERLIRAGEIKGETNETTTLLAAEGVPCLRIVVVGLGERGETTVSMAREAAGCGIRTLVSREMGKIAMLLDPEWSVPLQRSAVIGALVASEGQDLYRAKKKIHAPEELLWPDAWSNAMDQGIIIGEAVNLTRQLVNEPPNCLYPESFASAIQSHARSAGLDVEIWDEKKLTDEKCGALLAVGRGSARPPRLAILRHQGADPQAPVLGLVGKGVTFDSGGLSLKPTDGMKAMKCDMAGAASVVGAMCAIARQNLPVNVVGVTGMVENMPSRDCYKLGDVVTARNGTTIEILNTDAEGRLVLADALNVACNEGGASRLVDVATLTGACVVALGESIAGLMTNDQDWCEQVKQAGQATGESLWQLPMHDEFGKQIESNVADIRNTGTARWGGAMTAAKLLEQFVEKRPWVHMDIAGPAYLERPTAWRDAGATGFSVPTLVELASQDFPSPNQSRDPS